MILKGKENRTFTKKKIHKGKGKICGCKIHIECKGGTHRRPFPNQTQGTLATQHSLLARISECVGGTSKALMHKTSDTHTSQDANTLLMCILRPGPAGREGGRGMRWCPGPKCKVGVVVLTTSSTVRHLVIVSAQTKARFSTVICCCYLISDTHIEIPCVVSDNFLLFIWMPDSRASRSLDVGVRSLQTKCTGL